MIPRGRGLRQYDAKMVSDMTSLDSGTEVITQQHFKDEVDINTIVRRFGLMDLPQWNNGGVYGDFTGIVDFDSALAKIKSTEEAFMRLPAELRDKFDNDPAELVRYAQSVTEPEFDAFVAPPVPPVQPFIQPPAPPLVP